MTHRASADDYDSFLLRARADDNVLGAIIVGPHAANAYVTPDSDYDTYVVLRRQDESWATSHGSPVEVWPMTLDAFRAHAMPGSRDEWNRPTFLNARVDLDRLNGQVAVITERKSRLDASEGRVLGGRSLDGYMNSLYRSLKNFGNGRELAGRLDALESLAPFLTMAFALEGRVRPFNKWLRHELGRRPLAWPNVPELVETVASDPSPSTQRMVFNEAEPRARAAGLSEVVDGWEPDLEWLRGSA
jgi:hypothetical protein